MAFAKRSKGESHQKTTECLKEGGCRMESRCATRSYLQLVRRERPWTGRPSTTQLIQGTMCSFLKLTRDYAIVTNPGAPSRRGETAEIKKVLRDYYVNIEEVREPGTVEAGDIMMVGSHFFVGISERTNESGAQQVIACLAKYGLSGSVIKLKKVLHLKTGVAYLEHNNLVACGEFLSTEEFQRFNILKIDEDESYAANCVWVNDRVLIPKGHPKARTTIERAGYLIKEVDVSEFRKLDGGVSCLSLRF
jgi:dimethylargininase